MNLTTLIARARETGVAPLGAPAPVVQAAAEAAAERERLAAEARLKEARRTKTLDERPDGRQPIGFMVSLGKNNEPDVFVPASDADDRTEAIEVAFRQLGINHSEKAPTVERIYE